ncbi:DNA cross-link repair protein SNM1 isoform X2 [Arachis ipaensis]|uniref:DNA cross-link repair protein SNM1 isoform X2 n=1 Tax=Arachis ipaensis TaxID=130454 RepID=UPI000A2B805F|nr:DNA cross-link repair protein SNM1 isoform X2 [Arachis ipaensis]
MMMSRSHCHTEAQFSFPEHDYDDDDFHLPLTQTTLAPSNPHRPSKKLKHKSTTTHHFGKENVPPYDTDFNIENCSLDCIPSTIDCATVCHSQQQNDVVPSCSAESQGLKEKTNCAYFQNSIESKLVALGPHARLSHGSGKPLDDDDDDSNLDLLLNLCNELDEDERSRMMPRVDGVGGSVLCPLCDVDISSFSEEERHRHTNHCLDRVEDQTQDVAVRDGENDGVGAQLEPEPKPKVANVSAVVDWLRSIGLAKYEDIFVREEVDWDTLQWLKEEDAFKYLRGDCSHWFLTHFHLDHYQGLTKSFSHGKIYCSSITASLVNINIGIAYDKIHVLPLNEKVSIDGVDVTCLDANHCPGSIIILFQPPNGKAVLHTGDFRYSEEIANNPFLRMCRIRTLILDTTYCNPQYDFPKQEAVIQFVIDAIQAEAFNPQTLFLIGSYTIGKERLFLEVARTLRKKVYVTAAKLRLLKCLGFREDDMQWFTLNEHESNIHVAPMWTLASFKRLKHISSQYAGRFSLIVAFSPTGWTFGKGKKKSPGRRWQQGTIIRYEVPYSEHCSYAELKEFVKLISPDNIIPSVNNNGPESVDAMISLMLS